MKLKRLISTCLAGALMMSMAACSGGNANSSATGSGTANSNSAGKQVKLTLWSQFPDPNSKDGNAIAFYRALESIKKDMPNVVIEHDGTENEAYKVKLKTAMAGNELPDIFFNWGAGTTKPYVDGGLVLSLDEYLSSGVKDKLLSGTSDNFTFNGKTYGLPFSVAVASLYVNTELFKQNNLKLPETYDDLKKAITTFNQKGITPISLGEKDLWPGLMTFGILGVRYAGADAMNAALKKQGSWDTPEFVAAATELQNLTKMHAFGKNTMGTSEDDAVAAFKQGKAAMMFMGSWLNGDCEANDSPVKGKISVIKFPTIPGGKDNINEFHGGSGETFLVSSATKNPKEAAKVVEYLCEKMSKEQYLAGSGMPAWKADMGDTSKLNRLSVEIAKLTADSTSYVYWLDSMSESAFADSLKNEIGMLITGSTTPSDFCKNLQALSKK